MTYYLTVDVGTFKHHVFAIKDRVVAENAYIDLREAITNASGPYPDKVSVDLVGAGQASFRRTDLRAVSLQEGVGQ